MNEMLEGLVRRVTPLLAALAVVGCGGDDSTGPKSMAEMVEGVYDLTRVEYPGLTPIQTDVPGCETVTVPVTNVTITICAEDGSLILTAETELGGTFERSVTLSIDGQQETLQESGTFQVAGDGTAIWFDLTLVQEGGSSTLQAEARADGTEVRLEPGEGSLEVYSK